MCKPRQCMSEDRMKDVRCQGIPRHEGPHWAYDEGGQLIRWKNKRDKDPMWKHIGCSWTPSTHKTWIHPSVMNKHHYMTIWAAAEKKKRNDKTGNS